MFTQNVVEEVRITHAVADAKEAVKSIKPGDLAEVKSYKKPDPIVMNVVQVTNRSLSR